MCRYGMSHYKMHYVCLPCRVSAKYEWLPTREHRCPRCGAPMITAGFDFAAPPKRDESGWRALEATLNAGIKFLTCGCSGPGYRPRTSAQVRERRAAAERLGIPEEAALTRAEPWDS
ncbi:hypothetical protein [Labedaea rhizosphaerae]|uniref:Deoxyxylulose-5-phosphate synthase n=1 Tax=Labedaea rhizosphaerae TaxID=598644 RepID=A0A4R6SHK9_LABRH|nr:hypothetical protein [Labedaea rhizosphaerae]TDQ01040.1 hypothetical protein EV186_102907 [Labedaea rhizosphaerae]